MNKLFIFSLLFLSSFLDGANLDEIWRWYNNKEYSKVCSKQVTLVDYFNFNDDENFINMYAYSCLETDMINRLARPITQLRKSKESRANATYYTTILYQKKLLYQAIIDGLTSLPSELPSTHYILSKIYHDYVKGNYELKENIYFFHDKSNAALLYKLFIKKDVDGFTKLVLQTEENGTIIKTRMYW